MRRMLVSLFIGLVFIVAGSSAAFALQAGGVEIGDLETGSVVGQPFRELLVDHAFFALEGVGGKSLWYPPSAVVSLKERQGQPVVFKVTNDSAKEHGFFMAADPTFAAPTSLTVKIVLKPGETKYIGIPTSDLTYTTTGGVLYYKCHLHEPHLGGQLLLLK